MFRAQYVVYQLLGRFYDFKILKGAAVFMMENIGGSKLVWNVCDGLSLWSWGRTGNRVR